MPSSDYKHKPGGGLKLKGAGSSSGASDPSKKKKKKSSTSKKVREGDEEGGVVTRREQAEPEEDEYEQVSGGGAGSGSTSSGPPRTKAELKFEEVKRQRLLAKASKAALKSHKERVAEFNEQLENTSQHYDIPKVGPG